VDRANYGLEHSKKKGCSQIGNGANKVNLLWKWGDSNKGEMTAPKAGSAVGVEINATGMHCLVRDRDLHWE
jgi:hypothetical protein